jgi:hypothetical protein
MSAEADKIRESIVNQLSSFDARLDAKIADANMLAEIQDSIGRLLGSNGGNEADIRRVLQDRYDSGDLRKETFQLVKSTLDRYVTERIPTSSGMTEKPRPIQPQPTARVEPDKSADEDPLSSTAVIPKTDAVLPDSADGCVQIGSVLRDRYMLQERVTGGSMGVVYKAMDRRMAEAGTGEPWVAVKILSPKLSRNGKALRALQQEAAKGRCLVHPNIVRFIDLDRDDDLYFIVMEWLEGRTLADILDSDVSSSIDIERAFKITRQIGKALDYAHRCGIVHADVKPANIMIVPNGDAKLFDFGVARVSQTQLNDDPDFDPGVLGLLTPAYSSMQVLTGETPTSADDVFSLACLLYRLIAGYRVFGPRNAAEAAAEGMNPQRLDKIGDARWRVLKKALSYSRVTRFDSMSDFIAALDIEAAASITEDIPNVVEPAASITADFPNVVEPAASITADIPIIAEVREPVEKRGSGRPLLGLAVLLLLGGVLGNQMGWLDEFKARYLPEGLLAAIQVPVIEESVVAEPAIDDSALDESVGSETAAREAAAQRPDDESSLLATEPADMQVLAEESAVEEPLAEAVDDSEIVAVAQILELPEPEIVAVPLVDFSRLPPPTAMILVTPGSGAARSVTVTLREDRGTATVDLVRTDVAFPLTLRLEEIGFTGNRSPIASGQYTFSGNGIIEFPVGQDRARISLSMTSDPLREADQQSTLRVREADNASSELALITVILEDDDQRAFELTLPANTVAFATSQVSVRERDPAAQIDIIRFNPDDMPLVIAYSIRDITATRGEDYFAPSGNTIEFGPGQRSARLLIPLVQDSAYEDNEAFSVELSVGDSMADTDLFRRIAVMIRDDDY